MPLCQSLLIIIFGALQGSSISIVAICWLELHGWCEGLMGVLCSVAGVFLGYLEVDLIAKGVVWWSKRQSAAMTETRKRLGMLPQPDDYGDRLIHPKDTLQ